MKHIFEPGTYFTVPDGTDVSPFLNATDSAQAELAWGSLGDISIAAGRISARSESWIPMHPAVVQITYLLEGELTICMRDRGAGQPSRLT